MLEEPAASKRVKPPQLDQFHTQDRPAYERWMNTHFGQQLTALRELSRQVSEQQQTIAEVEDYLWNHEVSEAEAYAAVQQRHARSATAGPPPEPDRGNPPDFADPDAETEWDGKSAEEAFNEFAKAFEERFGHQLPPELRPPVPPAKADPAASVKELYRTLVRKLHPDKQAMMTSQKLEWWHEVQAACAGHDAERLATILGLVELSEGEPSAHTNGALFQRLAGRLKANLRDVKRQLSDHRRDPACDSSSTRTSARWRSKFGWSSKVLCASSTSHCRNTTPESATGQTRCVAGATAAHRARAKPPPNDAHHPAKTSSASEAEFCGRSGKCSGRCYTLRHRGRVSQLAESSMPRRADRTAIASRRHRPSGFPMTASGHLITRHSPLDDTHTYELNNSSQLKRKIPI